MRGSLARPLGTLVLQAIAGLLGFSLLVRTVLTNHDWLDQKAEFGFNPPKLD